MAEGGGRVFIQYLDLGPNTTLASLLGKDCLRPYKEINNPSLNQCGTLSTSTCPGLSTEACTTQHRDPKMGHTITVMDLALIPCKQMDFGPNSTTKASSWGEDCQDHIRGQITHPTNVEHLTIITLQTRYSR